MKTSAPADRRPFIFTATDVPLGRRWIVYPDLGILLIATDLTADEERQALEEFHATAVVD